MLANVLLIYLWSFFFYIIMLAYAAVQLASSLTVRIRNI